MAQLVREGVEAILSRGEEAADPWENLFSVVGKLGGDGQEEAGREHDRHLDEAYGDWRAST